MEIFPSGMIGVGPDSRGGNEGYARGNEGVLGISEDVHHVPMVPTDTLHVDSGNMFHELLLELNLYSYPPPPLCCPFQGWIGEQGNELLGGRKNCL